LKGVLNMATKIRQQISDLRDALLRLQAIGADTRHTIQAIEALTNQLLVLADL
jgi:hypothetical protein